MFALSKWKFGRIVAHMSQMKRLGLFWVLKNAISYYGVLKNVHLFGGNSSHIPSQWLPSQCWSSHISIYQYISVYVAICSITQQWLNQIYLGHNNETKIQGRSLMLFWSYVKKIKRFIQLKLMMEGHKEQKRTFLICCYHFTHLARTYRV